jgi:myosin heavy subunit
LLFSYRLLDGTCPPSGSAQDKENSIKLFSGVLGEPTAGEGGWQVGTSKLFIKDAHDVKLENKREEIFTDKAVKLQRYIRGALARKRFQDMKASMGVIQVCLMGRSRHYSLAPLFASLLLFFCLHLSALALFFIFIYFLFFSCV